MATKTRRPVAMVTPPPSKARSLYSESEKQSILDNFDLEVADKTRTFRGNLSATLNSFLIRQETEILKIPRELRTMTLSELDAKWGGSWAGTLQRIARERIEVREREEEEAAKEKVEEKQGKRKRGTANTLDASPVRSNKDPRRDPKSSASKQPLGLSNAANKRKPVTKGRPKPSTLSSSTSITKGPSTLPQNHVFNPLLPPTPSCPRQPRRNESLISLNGSPIAHEGSKDDDDGDDREDDDDDDADDLPDPEAVEREFLSRRAESQNDQPSRPSRKNKRAPSLMFGQSIVPPSSGGEGDDVVLASVPLIDGRTLSFNPLNLSPGRMDDEIDEGGLSAQEKERVKTRVREEVFKALTAKMERWKVA